MLQKRKEVENRWGISTASVFPSILGRHSQGVLLIQKRTTRYHRHIFCPSQDQLWFTWRTVPFPVGMYVFRGTYEVRLTSWWDVLVSPPSAIFPHFSQGLYLWEISVCWERGHTYSFLLLGFLWPHVSWHTHVIVLFPNTPKNRTCSADLNNVR